VRADALGGVGADAEVLGGTPKDQIGESRKVLPGPIGTNPRDPAIFPSVPTGTETPSLCTGIVLGAHVYPLRLGPTRIGIGASGLRVRATATPAAPDAESDSTSSSTTIVATNPDVDATFSSIAPELSLTFGSSHGWS
jgi:hypothetical protein